MADEPHFETLMSERFGNAFGRRNLDREPRKGLERFGTRTAEEHAKVASTRSKLVNFKTTPATHAFLKQLATDMGISMTDVIEQGIQAVAEKHKGK